MRCLSSPRYGCTVLAHGLPPYSTTLQVILELALVCGARLMEEDLTYCLASTRSTLDCYELTHMGYFELCQEVQQCYIGYLGFPCQL
jgi:hypothetical protein